MCRWRFAAAEAMGEIWALTIEVQEEHEKSITLTASWAETETFEFWWFELG
jgi:hypothetical protein